jgi:hypothetical protein
VPAKVEEIAILKPQAFTLTFQMRGLRHSGTHKVCKCGLPRPKAGMKVFIGRLGGACRGGGVVQLLDRRVRNVEDFIGCAALAKGH